MIRQKYESISQSDYSCENQLIGNTQHHDNVGDYLNFGDEMNQGHNHALENFDTLHRVKQEDIECDYIQHNQQKNYIEHFDQAPLPFLTSVNSNLIGEPSYFLYKQQSIIQVNSNATPMTGAGHSAALTDNSQLSAKMKRIMKREKAKSRRKLNLEQLQQQQSIIIDSQYKGTLPIISLNPTLQQQPIHNLEDQNLYYKKSVEYKANNQKLETRNSSLSCSSSSNVQIDVKIETPSADICGSSISNGNLNSSNLLEQSLKNNMLSSNEDQQLKSLLLQCSGGIEQKQQKKVMQMIRNRISAQNSRDRKKAYITKLESEKDEFFIESIDLRDQLNQAQKELANEKSKNENLFKEIQELKKKLQCQHQSSNANSEIIDLTSIDQPFLHNNSIQKNYSAFNVALFALLGVVLIFNSKPNKTEQDSINQSSQMMKMLDDLSKSTQDISKMAQMKNQKDKLTAINSSVLNDKKYSKEEISIQIDEETQPNSMDEESPLMSEQSSIFSLFSKQSQPDQIQKDQWIQFVVPKQDNQNLRDDVSRDSAETDITHNSSSKYLQVWAQIKSVQEFEQTN